MPRHSDVGRVRELRERLLEAALADVAPRAHDVGPDVDLHGVCSSALRCGIPTAVGWPLPCICFRGGSMRAIAEFVLRHRRLVGVTWLLVVIAGVALTQKTNDRLVID